MNKRLVLHHARGEEGAIVTQIVTQGAVKLEPPGLTLPSAAFFG